MVVVTRVASAQVAVDVVHAFPSAGAVQPGAPLLRASNGLLYGTTQLGGAHNAGTIFSLAADGRFTVLHEFDGVNGSSPNALIEASDGFLYGTTLNGGLGIVPANLAKGFGTAFRISVGGEFELLHKFTNTDGELPSALIQGSDSFFYGTTTSSDPLGGTVFRMTADGALTTIHAFSQGGGSEPRFGVVEGTDGLFYGVTDFGGFGANCGTVFRIANDGTFETIREFGEPLTDCHPIDRPQGPLVLAPDGSIFGATTLSLFVIQGTTVTTLIAESFSSNALLFGPLTIGTDALYSALGNVVIRIDGTGANLFRTFSAGEGAGLNALVLAPDGNFYGTAQSGGASQLGTVFKMTTSGNVTVLHNCSAGTEGASPVPSLTQASDGRLYGKTAFGGAHNAGTVFRASLADGNVEIVEAFEPDDTVVSTFPTTRVIQAASGDFYGTASNRAFKLTSDGALTPFLFPFPWGQTAASLVQGTDGQFYGTNVNGQGDAPFGAVFSMTPDGAFTRLHAFSQTEGSAPAADLIQGIDGLLYGVTSLGGPSNAGSVFKMSLDGSLKTLHAFGGGGDGANPVAPLLQTADGRLYGTTPAGGGAGTVFTIAPSGDYAVLHSFTGGAGGAGPTSALILASDGNLYGTTQRGGDFDLGTIFRLAPNGSFLVVHSFDGTDGAQPSTGLVTGADGHMYGTTAFGGPGGGGVVYRVALPPCTDTLTLAYTGGTLTMGFTVAASTAATFSTWFVHSSGIANLWSVPVPAIAPSASFNVPIAGFPHIGTVGVLTVLSAPGWPNVCYDFQVVDTGGPTVSSTNLLGLATQRGLIPSRSNRR